MILGCSVCSLLPFPCRLDATADGGCKTVVPIRPIACIAGNLDIADAIVRMM